jgi:hypothetical protein
VKDTISRDICTLVFSRTGNVITEELIADDRRRHHHTHYRMPSKNDRLAATWSGGLATRYDDQSIIVEGAEQKNSVSGARRWVLFNEW